MNIPSAGGTRPRLLADHNFNDDILAVVRGRVRDADIATARQLALQRRPDPELLERAKELDRILITHDVKTMPGYFKEFVARLMAQGEHSPGVIYASNRKEARDLVIDDLELALEGSTHEEYRDIETWLPFTTKRTAS